MKGVTHYQLEILKHVQKGGPDGALDFDQLLELLSWRPTKESAQFTIRAVVKKALMLKGDLELRRGRKRVLYQITPAGLEALDPRLGFSEPAPAPEEKPMLPTPGVVSAAEVVPELKLEALLESAPAEDLGVFEPGVSDDIENILEFLEP